jgi:hypothetical protein
MIAYTIFIILSTLIVTSGILFWIISLFTGELKRPILSLIAYIFWPLSLAFISLYVYFYNLNQSRKINKGR